MPLQSLNLHSFASIELRTAYLLLERIGFGLWSYLRTRNLLLSLLFSFIISLHFTTSLALGTQRLLVILFGSTISVLPQLVAEYPKKLHFGHFIGIHGYSIPTRKELPSPISTSISLRIHIRLA